MPTVEIESKIVHVACEACVEDAVQAERKRCAEIAKRAFVNMIYYPPSYWVKAMDHCYDKADLCERIASKILETE